MPSTTTTWDRQDTSNLCASHDGIYDHPEALHHFFLCSRLQRSSSLQGFCGGTAPFGHACKGWPPLKNCLQSSNVMKRQPIPGDEAQGCKACSILTALNVAFRQVSHGANRIHEVICSARISMACIVIEP